MDQYIGSLSRVSVWSGTTNRCYRAVEEPEPCPDTSVLWVLVVPSRKAENISEGREREGADISDGHENHVKRRVFLQV